MNEQRPLDNLTSLRATALVEHYQKTREQVTRSWEQRNRRYLLLVGLLAIGILLSFAPAIFEALARYALNEISGAVQKALPNRPDISSDITRFFDRSTSWAIALNLLMIVLLVSVFYLMTDLFHRSSMLVNSYVYLALVESEIRSALLLSDTHVAFTREGSFYRVTGARMSLLIGLANKGMLGCLLIAFFALRLLYDYQEDFLAVRLAEQTVLPAWAVWAQRNFQFLLDVLTLVLTAGMFWGYLTLRSPSETKVRDAIAHAVRLA